MNRFVLTALIWLISGNLCAETLDLLQTYQLALEQDARIRAAAAERLADREAAPQARADLLPAIQANAEKSHVRQDSTSNFTDGVTHFDEDGYGISGRQPLFNWGRWVSYQQAQLQADRADTAYSIAQQDLILRVAERYLNVLNAQASLEVAQAEHTALERQLDQVKQRFEVGLIPITDVHDAQARFDLAYATLIAAEDALSSSQEALHEIIQRRGDALARLATNIPLMPPQPNDIDSWVKTATEDNLNLLLARSDVTIAKQGISLQRAAHLPTLDLVGSHTYRDSGSGNLGSGFTTESDTVGIELNLSLFEGGKAVSRTREAAYRHQQSLEDLKTLYRETERGARDAYRSVITSTLRIQALRQAVVSNESALEANQVGLEVGTRTIVDVLDAQRNLSLAQLQLTQARHNYILNILRLKQSAGSLSEEDLNTVNAWLEPAVSTPE